MPTFAEHRKSLKERQAQRLGTVPDTAQEDAQIERAQVQNALKVSTRPGTERTVLDIYRDMLRPSNADAYAQESRSRIQRQLSRNAQARELLGSKQLSTWNVDESDRALRALDAQGQQQAEFVKRFKTDEDYTHYVKDQAFDEQSKAIASYADWKKGYRQAQADGDAYTAKKYLAWGQNAQDQGTRARAEEIARNATAQQLEKLAKMPTGERNLFRKELEARREQEAQKRQQDASTLRSEMNRLYDEIESGFAVDENGEERLLTQAEIIERKNRLNRLQTAQKNAGTEQAGPITLAQYENNQRVAQWEREAQAGQLDTFWNRYMADNGQADAYAQAAEGSYQGDNADAQAINDQLLGIYARINEIDQYEESVWGTEAETGKELQSMQQERAQLQGQAEQLQAEADGKAKEERENARDEQRAARELMYGKASVGRYIKASLMEGATNFANGFYQSLNVLVGKSITAAGRLFDEDYKSGITRFSERYKREVSDKQTAEAEMATQALGGGAALQTGRQVMGSLVENVPNTIMAIMTGGAAAAGGLATAQRAAIASMNQVGTGAAMRVAQGMLGDAQYWTSFMRELGSACDEAEQNGASPLAATLYSTVTALINAGIEVGGGIEKIGQESDPTLIGRALKAATGRDFKALEAILDSAGDEGTEEIKQYIVGALARKAIYDHGLPYYSNEEDAVINPTQMGENAMLGALTGGLLAGGNAAVDALGGAATRTRRQDTAVGESIVSNDWQQTLGHIAQEEAGVNNSTVNKLIAGGQVSLRKLGKLYRETVKNVSEGTKAWFEQSLAKPIAETLRAQGYSGNMELAATAVAKAYGLESYDTLTSKEASILAEPEVKNVLAQLEGGERLDVWEQKETQTPDAKMPVAQEDAAGTENRTQDTGERLTQWEAEQPGSYAAESVLPGTQEAAEIAAETVPETQEMPKKGIKKIPVKTAVKANADERLTQYDAQGGRQHAQTQAADVQNAQTQTADTQSEQTQVDGESYEKMVKRARTLAGAMQTLKVMPALQRGAIMAQDVVESMRVAAAAAQKAQISEDGQTHVTVDGQDVVAETVGIAWDQAGTPQLKVRINGQIESVAMDRVRFGSREAATRAMAASTIGGTEIANTLYNAKVQQGTRFLDYARDFMSAYRAAGMGIKKETLRYAGTLTALNELELDAAYEMGRRSASAIAQAKGLNRTEAVRYFKAVLEAAGETNVNGLAAALADAVQRGTVSGAQADLISASPSAQVILQGREVRTDMDGTLTARAYGQSGRSYAELMDTLQGMGMTRGQADSEAVRTAYQQAREQDNARAQRKAARPDTRGGLRDITAQEAERAGVGVVNREGMSARQQAYTQALEALAGQLGVDMVLYESPVKDGVHVGRDGWYDRSTGTIYIDVEAGYKGEQAMMRVAAHELTHYIEQWNPKGYQSLRELLLDYYYQKDYDTVRALVQEQLELAQQNGQRIGEAEAMDEVIANACEMMLSDAEAITAIAQKNQTLGKRIRAWIERTLSAMKEALKGLKPHSSAAKLLEKSRETLESARGMWLRALDEISQGEAQQAQETGTQGSQRTEGYDYSQSWETQIDEFEAFPHGQSLLIGRTPLLYRQLGISDLPMTINWAHVDHMLNGTHATDPADHRFTKAEIRRLPQLLEAPVAIIKTDTKADSGVLAVLALKSDSGKQAVAAVEINGYAKVNGDEVIDSNAVTTVHGRKNTLRMLQNAINSEMAGTPSVYYIKKAEAQSLLDGQGVQFPRTFRQDGLIHSIFDAGVSVNRKYMEQTQTRQFKRWFGSSVVRDAQGMPQMMYRGDNNDINVFDRKKSKASNLYGRGFYFTQDAGAAGVYGKVNAYYLRVENPLDASSGAHTITQEQLRAYLQEVADNEDYGLDNYGYGATVESVLSNLGGKADFDALQDVNATAIGDFVAAVELFNEVNGTHYDGIITPTETVVFDSRQIKSATDNAGTFDRANPDVRYSNREVQDIATNGIRMGQSDGERYQWLRDAEIEAASVSAGQITPQQIALVNGMGYTQTMELLERAAKSYGLIADGQQKAATLQNKHLSIAAEFSKRSLSESLRKQSHAADGNHSTGNGYIAALLPVFKETYENAVPVLVQGDRYLYTVTDESSLQAFAYLLGAFTYNDTVVPVQFEVKRMANKQNSVYVVATIKETALTAALSPANAVNHAATQSSTGAAIMAARQGTEVLGDATTQPLTLSIQDVIANVNPEDTRILANLPSYMLTEEQQAGKREGLKEKGEYLYNKARAAGQDVNAPVKLTQERIDRAIRDYGGSGDYSRAYMAMISPTDFLSLTATDADRIRTEGRVLVAEELRAEQQTPFLQYDPETNEITGHEGRHRMAAMENSHVQETPVLLIPDGSEGRYSRQNVDSLTVSGQRYGARRAQGETTLHSLIPVNEKHRAELEASFGGGEGWFRYSQRDGTLSDRQLLAQAFEGIVRTDADKTRLREYKKRIEELDTATAQLKELEAQLSDLSSVDWAKGLELPDSCKG